MDFWDTFWPTFLANVSAFLIFAISWASLNRRTRRQLGYIARSVSRSRREWIFRARFFRLVLRGRRRWIEYDNWLWSERYRRFFARVVYEAPAARAHRIRNIMPAKLVKRSLEDAEWLLSPESAFVQLVKASEKLPLREFGSTSNDSDFRSMSSREKAQFLGNETPNGLLLWALQLGYEDRRAWYNWLISEECLTQLEAVFSELGEP